MEFLFKIIVILFLLLIAIALLVFFLSFFGGMFSIGYVIKKSVEKKTPEFLSTEKEQMIYYVEQKKTHLSNWNNYGINHITNNLNYKYLRWITSELSGNIIANDGNKIIAFERRQRGNYIDCRIYAISTEFKYFIEFKNNLTIIDFNGEYLGKIIDKKEVFDASNKKIAEIDRFTNSNHIYINFSNGTSATINKSFDNKVFINNPHFGSWHKLRVRRKEVVQREQYEPYNMIESANSIDENSEKWLIAIVLKETIYYSFSFVS